MTVFGKQDSADSMDRLNGFSKNSIPLPAYDKKVDEILSCREDSSATLSRSAPKPADTEPINIVFSYEHSPQNRAQGIGKPSKKTKA